MRTLIIIILVSVNFSATYSQDAYYNKLEKIIRATPAESSSRMKFILRNELSSLLSVNSNNVFGNYIGVSSTDENLKYSFNTTFYNSFVGLEISGKISNGISTLFNDNKINSGVGAKFTWSKIFGSRNRGNSLLSVGYDHFENLQKELDILALDKSIIYDKETIELKKLKKDSIKLNKEIQEIKSLIKKLSSKEEDEIIDLKKQERYKLEKHAIDLKIKNKLTQTKKCFSETNSEPEARLSCFKLQDSLIELKKDSVKVSLSLKDNIYSSNKLIYNKAKLKIMEKEMLSLKVKLSSITLQDESEKKIIKYQVSKKKTLDKIYNYDIIDLHFDWVTFSLSTKRQDYNIFDASLSQDSIFLKRDDMIQSISLSYSNYTKFTIANTFLNSKLISFWTTGVSISSSNNHSVLPSVKVEIHDDFVNDQVSVFTQKDYLKGSFEKNLIEISANYDYFVLIQSLQNLGFHFNLQVDYRQLKIKPSVRIGVLLSTTTKKNSSTANFEIFYGLNDFLIEDGKVIERNIFGIQTTLPISLK